VPETKHSEEKFFLGIGEGQPKKVLKSVHNEKGSQWGDYCRCQNMERVRKGFN
jgi:hypothetical protein